jgi:hypothetical protein
VKEHLGVKTVGGAGAGAGGDEETTSEE